MCFCFQIQSILCCICDMYVHVCMLRCIISNSCDPMDRGLPSSYMSMGFSRQEQWSGLPYPPPGNFPNPVVKSTSPALASRFFTTSTTWEAHTCYDCLIMMSIFLKSLKCSLNPQIIFKQEEIINYLFVKTQACLWLQLCFLSL